MNYTAYRYLLFAFDDHESYGGMNDLVFKFNTFDEFINNYEYKDLYYYQLVDTTDFSFKEFNTSIIYHAGMDDYDKIKKQREKEFIEWVRKQISQ